MAACPKCESNTALLAGAVVYPNDKARGSYAYHVCWACGIAQCTSRPWEPIAAKREKTETRSVNWVSHTIYHRQTTVDGEVLDYWPTKKKFRFRGVTHKGDPEKFIRDLR